MNKVVKRDGRIVNFDRNKIVNAITKAMNSVGVTDDNLANNIATEIEKRSSEMSVEHIQDLVEEKLMASAYPSVAKAYILYRNE